MNETIKFIIEGGQDTIDDLLSEMRSTFERGRFPVIKFKALDSEDDIIIQLQDELIDVDAPLRWINVVEEGDA